VLTRRDSRENLALGDPVAPEFVSNDYARDVRQALKELTKELLCDLLVAATLHQDIQHVPVSIDGPPQIVMLALDRQKHLIEVLFIAGLRTAAT
jgi:hypothetical protein